jgi:pimeloyl-ACP methyl ester carboxylesterase
VPVKEGSRKGRSVHRWIRCAFLIWGVFATSWMVNSFRTQGVGEDMLHDSPAVRVSDGPAVLELAPKSPLGSSGLIFLCGSGVHPHAYVPLVRPIAEAGYPVFVVRLPYRFAMLESHKVEAIRRVEAVRTAHPDVSRWVVAGHSLGGALAARIARAGFDAAYVLIGTTHPKEADLSALAVPFTKVYATNDGVAPPEKVMANRGLLPAHTRWIPLRGGNHSQFGHYGHQLFDGKATIGRAEQQEATRQAILDAMALSGPRP